MPGFAGLEEDVVGCKAYPGENFAFMFELARFGLSPIGVEPEELAEDWANA